MTKRRKRKLREQEKNANTLTTLEFMIDTNSLDVPYAYTTYVICVIEFKIYFLNETNIFMSMLTRRDN